MKTSEYSLDAGQAAYTAAGWLALDTKTGGFQMGMVGKEFADAAIYNLARAELMAAQYGLVPLVIGPNGPKVGNIGAALDKIDQAPAEVAILYRASSRLAKRMHTQVTYAGRNTLVFVPPRPPNVLGKEQQKASPIGVNPWIVVAGVAGVAAILGGAWYATSTTNKRIEVEARSANLHSQVSTLVDYMAQSRALGQKPDPEVLQAINALGSTPLGGPESSLNYGWALPVGLSLAGTAIGVAGGLLGGWQVRGAMQRAAF